MSSLLFFLPPPYLSFSFSPTGLAACVRSKSTAPYNKFRAKERSKREREQGAKGGTDNLASGRAKESAHADKVHARQQQQKKEKEKQGR